MQKKRVYKMLTVTNYD